MPWKLFEWSKFFLMKFCPLGNILGGYIAVYCIYSPIKPVCIRVHNVSRVCAVFGGRQCRIIRALSPSTDATAASNFIQQFLIFISMRVACMCARRTAKMWIFYILFLCIIFVIAYCKLVYDVLLLLLVLVLLYTFILIAIRLIL